MNLKTYLKILQQVGLLEALNISFYIICGKFLIFKSFLKNNRLYYELIHVLSHFLTQKASILKTSKSNIIRIYDQELGSYSVELRRASSDFGVFDQCLIEKQYRVLKELSVAHTLEINTIIDAGANIGCTSIYLKKAFPSSTIIAIEPEKNNFSQLRKNIDLNEFKDMHLLNKGLWNTLDQDLKINNDWGDKRDWAFNTEPAKVNERNKISSVSIDSIVEKYQLKSIDILKLDIEGAEKYIFLEPKYYQSWLPICKLIAIEFHDPETEEKTKGILSTFGFSMIQHGELTIAYAK